MRIHHGGQLVQQQRLQIHLACSLLQAPGAVCDHADQLVHKGMVCCDSAIPGIHIISNDDGDQSVQLEVDLIRARQGRQQVLNRWRLDAVFP